MAQEKVTVRFESTMDSANSEPLLLSGPIQIFASVDVLKDPRDKDGKLLNDGRVGLDNIELIKAVKAETELTNIIVFVNDVAANESQVHRGAYFLYVGNRLNKSLNCIVEEDWQEILLGTHSHENKDQLDSLAHLPYGESEKDRLVAIDKEGHFKLVDNVELPILPALPPEFVNKIKELEDYRKLNEPVENEWHHLDAPLDELTDTYDWLRKDKDGNYSNIAVGNCRDLYHSLIKSDKKLYLTNKGELVTEKIEMSSSLALEISEVNFNPSKKEECDSVSLDSTNLSRTVLKLKLPIIIDNTDKIVLFVDGKLLSLSTDYEIVSREASSIIVRFNRNTIEEKISELTVLIARGGLSLIDIRDLFADNLISLREINNELIKLYIQDEFNRKPYIPQLYLTTDQYGNIHWDNKLLPTQYFYKKSIVINNDNLKHYYDEKLGKIKLVFEDAFFNIGNNDFPILLADQYFAFDLSYDSQLSNSKDLVYLLEKDNRYLDWNDEDEVIENSTTFTLLIIKNSANGSLADEIAEKYVSKEDAVKILSHGKINLKDYAKASDLIGFSRIGHTHSEYALAGHDHDYRYANYHHTHPELSAILAAATGLNAADVEKWINQLTGGISKLVFEVEENIKANKSLNDKNIAVTSDIIDLINHKIDRDGYKIGKLKYTATLREIIEYLIKFFELEYVYADQVVLPQDLYVTNRVGGITTEKYKKNTSLFDIVRDMLNPLVEADVIKKRLTPYPDTTKLEFYYLDSSDTPVKIDDPMKIKSWVISGGYLLFKVFLKNEDGKDCSEISYTGNTIRTVPKVKNYRKFNEELYIYSTDFDFQRKEEKYPSIEISWENERVYDSYGIDFVELNPEGESIELYPDFDFVYIDYYTGVLTEEEFKEVYNDASQVINVREKLKINTGSNIVSFRLSSNDVDYISVFMNNKNRFKIISVDTDTEISCFFEDTIDRYDLNFEEYGYSLYYYKVLNDDPDIKEIKLQIKILGEEV